MNKHSDNMIKAVDDCLTAEDLVTYVYDELAAAERLRFQHHIDHCLSCQGEIDSFGDVRLAIADWKQEALGAVGATANESIGPVLETTVSATRKPSAIAALRGFFALSPAWMRVATAAVAMIFCALAVIAVVHFTNKPDVVVLDRPSSNNVVELPVPPVSAPDTVAVKSQPETGENLGTEKNEANPSGITRNQTPNAIRRATQRRQAPPVKTSEPLLVAADDYLPFTAYRDEDKLPSLADLVDEENE